MTACNAKVFHVGRKVKVKIVQFINKGAAANRRIKEFSLKVFSMFLILLVRKTIVHYIITNDIDI